MQAGQQGRLEPETDREQLLQWFFAARRQIAAGRRDRAHELLAECLALEPDNLLVAKLFVENLIAWGNSLPPHPPRRRWPITVTPRTWRGITERLQHRPRDRKSLEALVRKWEGAAPPDVLAEVLPALARWCESSPACWRQAARALTYVGRCQEALECWRNAAECGDLNQEEAAVLEVLQRLKLESDQFHCDEELPAELAEVARLDRQASVVRDLAKAASSQLITSLAQRLHEHHRDTAIDVFRRRIDQRPHDHASRRELVQHLRDTGDWRAVQEALESAPQPLNDSDLLATWGELHQRRREFDAALERYDQAVKCLGIERPVAAAPPWLGQAVELAKACGEVELANRWSQLATKPPGDDETA